MIDLTRRECLTMLGGTLVAAHAARIVAATPGKAMRGPFIILNTPFTATGEVDWEDLEREVAFVDRGGCAGIVWPQGSSGVNTLTKEERCTAWKCLPKPCRASGDAGARCAGQGHRGDARVREEGRGARHGRDDRDAADHRNVDGRLPRLLPGAWRRTKRPVIVQTSGGAREPVPSTRSHHRAREGIPPLGVRERGKRCRSSSA